MPQSEIVISDKYAVGLRGDVKDRVTVINGSKSDEKVVVLEFAQGGEGASDQASPRVIVSQQTARALGAILVDIGRHS